MPAFAVWKATKRVAWTAAALALIAGCTAPSPAPPTISASASVATSADPVASTQASPSGSIKTSSSSSTADAAVGQASSSATGDPGTSPPDPNPTADSAIPDTNLPVLVIRESRGKIYGVIRPTSLSSTSGGETYIDKIIWSSWTATEAHADATRELESCVPDCARGAVTPVPMTIALSNPVDGAFTTLTITANGQSDTTQFEPPFYGFSSADADSPHLPYPPTSSGTSAPIGAIAPGDGSALAQDSLITPSGNIRCVIDNIGVFRCTIFKYDFVIGPCVDGYVNYPFITLRSSGTPTMETCVGDSWVNQPKEQTTYGSRYQVGDILCDVEETGVTCTNPDGHGFTVNRAAFMPF